MTPTPQTLREWAEEIYGTTSRQHTKRREFEDFLRRFLSANGEEMILAMREFPCGRCGRLRAAKTKLEELLGPEPEQGGEQA